MEDIILSGSTRREKMLETVCETEYKTRALSSTLWPRQTPSIGYMSVEVNTFESRIS
jgi:hypothetical protein